MRKLSRYRLAKKLQKGAQASFLGRNPNKSDLNVYELARKTHTGKSLKNQNPGNRKASQGLGTGLRSLVKVSSNLEPRLQFVPRQ